MDDVIALIRPLYKSDEIELIKKELETYSSSLPRAQLTPVNPLWYKNSNIYLLYPDSFASNTASPLECVAEYLPTILSLGCNAVHLLPFLESPMKDKGFDISDYYAVRRGLGGMSGLELVLHQAEKHGVQLFMDLVFNHVSAEHEWYKKALEGNAFYRDFFIHTNEIPQFLRKVHKNATVWAEYLVNGEKTLVSVAFPEFAGEVPHWVQGVDGYWYYHTYYPDQIDVNWMNPNVFIEFGKILLFWASKGFHFRLDAIPFIGKAAYKHLNTHNPFTHHLTASFNALAKLVNPHCTFILETAESFTAEVDYFGTTNIPQAQLLYEFHLTSALWVSLIEESTLAVWRQLRKDKHVPHHAQWINFLRNHDELSFTSLNDDAVAKIHTDLLPFGRSFREGYGIAGRTYSLLRSDEKHFLMAYFFLASLPGSILIPYGDEYGKSNIPEADLPKYEQNDVRNISRGVISDKEMQSEKGKRIFHKIAEIIERRSLLSNYLNIWPTNISSAEEIFAASYQLGISELCIFINLSSKQKTVHKNLDGFEEVAHINQYSLQKGSITLGPHAGIWLQK